jgi:hypothetical protein
MFSPELSSIEVIANDELGCISIRDYERIVRLSFVALKFEGSFSVEYTAGENSFFLNIYYPNGRCCWKAPYRYGMKSKLFIDQVCATIKRVQSFEASSSRSDAN